MKNIKIITNDITINGVVYEEIINNNNIDKQINDAYLYTFLVMYGEYNPKKSNISISKNELIKEFELIQNKSSNLSKGERDKIVREFNRLFKVKE